MTSDTTIDTPAVDTPLGPSMAFATTTGRLPNEAPRPETPAPPVAPLAIEPATDIDVAAAVQLFPAAPTSSRKTFRPSSPVPAVAALEAALDALRTPVPDPAAVAAAAKQAAVDIAKTLSPDQAISQRELERRAQAHVADTSQRAARAHLDTILPNLEQAIAEATSALAAAHAARRMPQEPPVGLTPDERALLDEGGTWAEERKLAAASLVEQRTLRRSIDRLAAHLAVTPDLPAAELLDLAATGTPAQARRADYHLDRLQMRQDTDDVAQAMREHLATKARHAAIRDRRVPASVRAAEQRELAYVEALTSHAQFRLGAVRVLQRERASLVGLFVGDDSGAIGVRRLRDEAVQAWAPVVARARQAREVK